jgi:hypothetical protein
MVAPSWSAVGDVRRAGRSTLAMGASSSAKLWRGSFPYSVAVGDFNGDGKPDLAVANSDSNNVSVLINNTPMAKQRSNGK